MVRRARLHHGSRRAAERGPCSVGKLSRKTALPKRQLLVPWKKLPTVFKTSPSLTAEVLSANRILLNHCVLTLQRKILTMMNHGSSTLQGKILTMTKPTSFLGMIMLALTMAKLTSSFGMEMSRLILPVVIVWQCKQRLTCASPALAPRRLWLQHQPGRHVSVVRIAKSMPRLLGA